MTFVSTIGAIAGFPDQVKNSIVKMASTKVSDQELRNEIAREHGVGLAEPKAPYFVNPNANPSQQLKLSPQKQLAQAA